MKCYIYQKNAKNSNFETFILYESKKKIELSPNQINDKDWKQIKLKSNVNVEYQ